MRVKIDWPHQNFKKAAIAMVQAHWTDDTEYLSLYAAKRLYASLGKAIAKLGGE